MKQVDFDETLRQMRMDHQQETSRLKKMIIDLDLQMAEHRKHLHKMHTEYEELKEQKAVLCKEKDRLDREHNEKYRNFVQTNQGHVSRQLEDVSEWALVNELAARGYTLQEGVLSHPENTEEWLLKLNAKLKPKDDTTAESV